MTDTHTPLEDMEPDLAEVQQTESQDATTVPVRIEGPVETRELPTKRISYRTVHVTTTGGRILNADPRRKSATLVPRNDDIVLGANQSQSMLNGAWWPSVVPYITTTCAEVWASASATETDISVIEEYLA